MNICDAGVSHLTSVQGRNLIDRGLRTVNVQLGRFNHYKENKGECLSPTVCDHIRIPQAYREWVTTWEIPATCNYTLTF